MVDKLKEYRQKNPLQLDIFHEVDDVIELRCIVSPKKEDLVGEMQFSSYLQERINLIKSTLGTKGAEYAGNGRVDKMHNFNEAANIIGSTPEMALHGMMSKHLVSYLDMIKDLDGGIVPDKSYIREKFGDIINYFILQEMQFLNRAINDEH